MTTDLARPTNGHADIVERVLVAGDLARLSPADRVRYYAELCASLHLNPLSKPFEYIVLNGKLQLYALKAATDQLRALHGVSITRLDKHTTEAGVYEVTATAVTADGRTDQDMGAVSIAGLRGEALCNAMLKAITKSKRRVTLSICGLGWLDETEIDSIPDARRVAVDTTTGEITAATMPTDMPPDMPTAMPPLPAMPTRHRSRAVPAGKTWSEAQLAYFWGSLRDLEPRVTPDEVHAALGVDSLHDWTGDLDGALAQVRKARAPVVMVLSEFDVETDVPDRQGGVGFAERSSVGPDGGADDEAPIGSLLDHPAGSIEAAWQRYAAVKSLAAAWNHDYPEQQLRWPEPPRDGTAAQVRATAEGLERRLSKLLGTRGSAG